MARLAKLRTPAVVLLTVLACVLSVLSLVTVWGRNQILDTDRYLASVTPLATDPVIQDEVAGKVSTAISARLNAEDLVVDALPSRAAFLGGILGDAVDEFVDRKTSEFVHSDQFVTLWTDLNRTAHQGLVRVLEGEEPAALLIEGGRLRLDLGPVVQAVRDRLVQAGLTVVRTLPVISVVVDVADAQGVERARVMVRHLDLLATVLPLLAIWLLLGAIALSRRRWTSGAAVLVAVTWSMVLTRALIALGAGVAADRVPAGVASTPAVHAYYSHLTSLLHRGALITGVVFAIGAVLLVAVGRWRGSAAGRRSLRLLILALSGIVLLVWPTPGTVTVVILLLGTMLMIVVARAAGGLGDEREPAAGLAVAG